MKRSRIVEIVKEEINKVLSEYQELNEMPVYTVKDQEQFDQDYQEFKAKGVKNKALNAILDKLKDEGTVDTKALADEVNKDSAVFNNPEIRKYLNPPKDEVFIDKKTGEELMTFAGSIDVGRRSRKKASADTSGETPSTPTKTRPKGRPKSSTPEKTEKVKSTKLTDLLPAPEEEPEVGSRDEDWYSGGEEEMVDGPSNRDIESSLRGLDLDKWDEFEDDF